MALSFDFAFEGFRIIRSKPYAVLAWGLLLLIGNGLSLYALTSLAGTSLDALQHMQGSQPATEAQAEAMLGLFPPILAGYGIALPLQLVVGAFVACAVYRAVLGREDKGLAWLGFGADELRQMAVGLLFALVAIGVFVVALIAISLVAGLLSSVLGIAPESLGFLAGVAAIAVTAAFAVRLSFFGVQTFDEEKINLFGSWPVTREYLWPLVAGYLVTGVMIALVYVLCFAIFAACAAAVGHGDVKVLDPILKGGTLTTDMFRSPVTVAYLIVANGLVAPLSVALSAGAPAAAYRSLRGTKSPARAENLF